MIPIFLYSNFFFFGTGMILAMLKAEGNLLCVMIELHSSVRCCVITGFNNFRRLNEHWSGPLDDFLVSCQLPLSIGTHELFRVPIQVEIL